jgi:hypothetical protein
MKTKLYVAMCFVAAVMFASPMAFACDKHGGKTADKGPDADTSVVSAVDQGDEVKAQDKDAKKSKKVKKSKKAAEPSSV